MTTQDKKWWDLYVRATAKNIGVSDVHENNPTYIILANLAKLIEQETRRRVSEEVRGMKIRGKEKQYDGNSLESASNAYCIAAESWSEIIRYEDGHDEAIESAASKIYQGNEKRNGSSTK